MQILKAELVLQCSNSLGEGPVWDERLGELFWVDIEEFKLQRYRPSDGARQEYNLGQKVGAAVPAEDGSWIAAMQQGFYRFDLATERLERLAANPEQEKGNRMNDGKCDAAGRFWAGTISGRGQKDANFYVLEPDGKLSLRHANVECSNGIAWSLDNKTMYYIDSGDPKVYAFEYEAATGTIAKQRAVIHFSQEQGTPDGMSIDAEGMLWIGHWGGWQVSRWNPLTGEQLAKVEVPVKNTTSCCFGGDKLDELYITTAQVGNNVQQLAEQPLAGSLFMVKPGVKGFPVQRARV